MHKTNAKYNPRQVLASKQISSLNKTLIPAYNRNLYGKHILLRIILDCLPRNPHNKKETSLQKGGRGSHVSGNLSSLSPPTVTMEADPTLRHSNYCTEWGQRSV